MAKYYLDEAGVRILVKNFNDNLSTKADRSELSDYATKADLQNVSVDLDGYATELYVDQQIASIPTVEPYDDTELTSRITSLEGKATGLYHFKGSVANLAALQAIENPEEGDTYNLEDTGMNAAWTGTEWDEFGSVTDLSEYAKLEDVQAITIQELNAILYSGKSATVSSKDGIVAMLANNQPVVEVTLNDDLTIDTPIIVPAGKKVTLNLGENEIQSGSAQAIVANGAGAELVLVGGSLSSNANCTVQAANGGKVTIDGATIVSTNNNCVGSVGEGSLLTVNSGNLTGQEYGVLSIDGGNVVVNGGNIKGIDNFAVGGNGTAGRGGGDVTINGGTLEGHITTSGYMATAIYWPNEGTLTINGGTIVTDGAGIVQRGGTININAGAVIEPSNTPVNFETGKAGDSRNVVGRYAVVYDYNSKYPAYQTMQLNIADGANLTGIDGDLQVLPADAPGITDNRQIIGD